MRNAPHATSRRDFARPREGPANANTIIPSTMLAPTITSRSGAMPVIA
jgi:hypothetical protein